MSKQQFLKESQFLFGALSFLVAKMCQNEILQADPDEIFRHFRVIQTSIGKVCPNILRLKKWQIAWPGRRHKL